MKQQIQSVHHLKFSIGGYGATHFEIELKDNLFSYRSYDYFPEYEQLTRVLTETEKINFVQALNKSGLPEWTFIDPEYHVLDGTQWELFLQYNGNLRKKFSESNRYPNSISGQDSPDYSPDFCKFLQAVNTLVPEWNLL